MCQEDVLHRVEKLGSKEHVKVGCDSVLVSEREDHRGCGPVGATACSHRKATGGSQSPPGNSLGWTRRGARKGAALAS